MFKYIIILFCFNLSVYSIYNNFLCQTLSSNWNNIDNWSLHQLPNINDTVNIKNCNVILHDNFLANINGLILENGNLSINGYLIINTIFNNNNGNLIVNRILRFPNIMKDIKLGNITINSGLIINSEPLIINTNEYIKFIGSCYISNLFNINGTIILISK